MAKIKRIKDKTGVMHNIGDADVSAYESTLSGAATNVPYSAAVKAAVDAVSTSASSALQMHINNQSNPHKVTAAQVGLGNVDNKSSATIRSEITSANVKNALGYTPLDSAKTGVAGGVATLDTDGKVPASQLPSYVDDVIEGYLYSGKFYEDSAHTIVVTAMTGKIYTDLSNNKTYRWSGTQYTEISPSLALGETSATAYRGDRGKIAYDHSQISGSSTIHHTHSNKSVLDGISATDVNNWNSKQAGGSYKTVQTAKTDPTASGTGITFISTISQDTNGVITATKKTVQSASTTQNGLMTKELVAKLNSAATAASVTAVAGRVSKLEAKGLTVSSDDDGDYLEFA